MRLVVISGHSGSGKTSALNILEDVGFTCVDNLPSSLLPELIHQLREHSSDPDLQLAVGIDARNLVGDLTQIPKMLSTIENSGVQVDVIFLKAQRTDLLRRYSETRRKHPLSTDEIGLKEAIDLEENIISHCQITSLTIDTSGLTLHQLRDLVKNTIVPRAEQHMTILFESFGFKQRIPNGSTLYLTYAVYPTLTGKVNCAHKLNDVGVIEFLEAQVDVASMLADIIGYLTRWIPKFKANNRSYLTISIGCTGGQHRSVYIATRLHEHFSKQYNFVQVMHKELATK